MVTINLAAAFLVMAAVAVTVRAAAKAVARIVVRVAARAATNPLPLTGFYVTDYDHLVNKTINTSETVRRSCEIFSMTSTSMIPKMPSRET